MMMITSINQVDTNVCTVMPVMCQNIRNQALKGEEQIKAGYTAVGGPESCSN